MTEWEEAQGTLFYLRNCSRSAPASACRRPQPSGKAQNRFFFLTNSTSASALPARFLLRCFFFLMTPLFLSCYSPNCMSVLKREVVSHSVRLGKGRPQKLLLSRLLLGGRTREDVRRSCDRGLGVHGGWMPSYLFLQRKPEGSFHCLQNMDDYGSTQPVD